MAQQQPARRKMLTSKTPVTIPDKLYFRIGDVARLCTLPAYVLRFWETEFPQLKPNKGGTGQRLYRKRDVEMVLEIKRLLYNEGFTIAGARRLLTEKRRSISSPLSERKHPSDADGHGSTRRASAPEIVKAANAKPTPVPPKIKELRQEMRELLTLLGPEPSQRKPLPAPARRETRKTREPDEPTLF